MPRTIPRKATAKKSSEGYARHAVPYALTRTMGGACAGYVMVGPTFTYRVIPTSKGFILEALIYGGTTVERVIATREYTVNPSTLEVKRRESV